MRSPLIRTIGLSTTRPFFVSMRRAAFTTRIAVDSCVPAASPRLSRTHNKNRNFITLQGTVGAWLRCVNRSDRYYYSLFFAASQNSFASHIGHKDRVDILFGGQLLERRDIRVPNLL